MSKIGHASTATENTLGDHGSLALVSGTGSSPLCYLSFFFVVPNFYKQYISNTPTVICCNCVEL